MDAVYRIDQHHHTFGTAPDTLGNMANRPPLCILLRCAKLLPIRIEAVDPSEDCMKLRGSCHCGAVDFNLDSKHPYPYQRCYCSICRKTQGGGGYSINLAGDARSLRVRGRKHISIYHAKIREPGRRRARVSGAERHFCSICGSGLWLFDAQWPDLIHPFASAIDTPLPIPPAHTHLLLDSKATWVEVDKQRHDKSFQQFPRESIAQWHERLDLVAR